MPRQPVAGPTYLQALLLIVIVSAATYLGALNRLAPEAVSGVFIAAIGAAFQDRRRPDENGNGNVRRLEPAPLPPPATPVAEAA